jgi:4-diphosphocytidyl-2-C-methyl-D-erythritol kinase
MYVASYAKINLFLEVLAKRPDGFHEVNTVFSSIDLCDFIRFALTKKPLVKLWANIVELSSTGNLIYRIAEFMMREFKPSQGVEIHLDKHIPIAAGLGGGSSNAAVTIMCLSKLWGISLTETEINEIAASFGSDINYFLTGGTANGRGRGESVTSWSNINLDKILLVNPNLHISAKEAYSLVKVPSEPRKWEQGSTISNCFNRLEDGIKSSYPVIETIIKRFRSYNPPVAMMSGSGSTCFAIFDSLEDLVECKAGFDRDGYWTKQVRTIGKEEYQSVFKTQIDHR